MQYYNLNIYKRKAVFAEILQKTEAFASVLIFSRDIPKVIPHLLVRLSYYWHCSKVEHMPGTVTQICHLPFSPMFLLFHICHR